MRLAIVNHLGDMAAGAEHALVQYVERLPASIAPMFILFEDGAFAQSLRERFASVTIVPMSSRVANAERGRLSPIAIPESIAGVLRVARVLRTAKPDVVLTNSMKAHIIGSLAAKLCGIPCINYIHDFVTGPARALLQVVSRTCAHERVTCSKAVAANLGIPRSAAVYSGIDTAEFSTLPDRAAARSALGLPVDNLPVVGLVGRIARWKGQDRFVRIAIDVIRDVDARFVIVGSPIFGCDEEYVPELTAAIAAAGLTSRVHFIPWQDDMRTVYGAIDLAANCSTREPFGRTMLEALASGIPIVCFDDAGSCEILAEHRCGTSVPAGDEIAFADAVRHYLTDPDLMARAKIIAREASRPFDVTSAFVPFAAAIVRVASLKPGRFDKPAAIHARVDSSAP